MRLLLAGPLALCALLLALPLAALGGLVALLGGILRSQGLIDVGVATSKAAGSCFRAAGALSGICYH